MEKPLIYPKMVDNPLLPFLTLRTGSETKADPKCNSWWVIWDVFRDLVMKTPSRAGKGKGSALGSLQPSLKLSRPVCASKAEKFLAGEGEDSAGEAAGGSKVLLLLGMLIA